MPRFVTAVLCAGISLAATAAPSAADDTGFAYMHDIRGRCFTDHFHYGNGSGRTKQAAMRDAIGSWSSFTALEYGSDWARWGRAAGKSASCSKDSSGVSCSISARPCK
jgi:hypothetical protein